MTDTIIYPTKSGIVGYYDQTYLTARAGDNQELKVTPDTTIEFGEALYTPHYYLFEAFFSFDTSGVVGTVSAATFKLTVDGEWLASGLTLEVYATDWGDSLAYDDWVPGADLSGMTLLASCATGASPSGTLTFSSEAAFLAAINTGGYTRLVLVTSNLRTATAPTGGELIDFKGQDDATPANRPQLVITHAASGIAVPVAMHHYRTLRR